MLSSSSSVSRWYAMSVFGKAGCGGPLGRGTSGARGSLRVAIFCWSEAFERVEGAMSAFDDSCEDVVCSDAT